MITGIGEIGGGNHFIGILFGLGAAILGGTVTASCLKNSFQQTVYVSENRYAVHNTEQVTSYLEKQGCKMLRIL